jgi:tetratricopeptide (TPR) repeat protein
MTGRRLAAVGVALVWLTAAAHAGEPGDDDDDLGENTITGGVPMAAPVTAGEAAAPPVEVLDGRPYPASSYRAAEALGSDVAKVDGCRAAVELIYQRRYAEARTALAALTTKYPTSGIGPFGMVLIYQALMFENFDYRYERQYKLASEQTRAQLEKGLAEDGDQAFGELLLAGTLGIDAIHSMRKGEFLGALNRAFEAMKALEATEKAAPASIDARLADGLYLYWRSVVTMHVKLLPGFPDRRAEGIAKMREAEAGGTFVGPAASLALEYAWIEERSLPSAQERGEHLRTAYPDNVINNMTLGRVYASLRRYDDALGVYGEILGDDPANQRVHYNRGVVLARMGRETDAASAYETYLGFPDVPKDARGQTLYRLGTIYERQHQTDKAAGYFREAVAVSNNGAAKTALARLKKEG